MHNIVNQNYHSNDFAIIASFARSLDNQLERDRIHLVSSCLFIGGTDYAYFAHQMDYIMNSNNPDLGEDLYKYEGNNTVIEDLNYVFIVTLNRIESNPRILTRYDENKVYIFMTLDQFLILIGVNLSLPFEATLFENVFGDIGLKSKDFDSISQQSIFIFVNFIWSSVVLKFKLNNIDISGGSITKRHVLQTVDIQLYRFMLELFHSDYSSIKYIVYNSLKNPILNSSISMDYYKEFLDYQSSMSDMTVKDIMDMPVYPLQKLPDRGIDKDIENVEFISQYNTNNRSENLRHIVVTNLKTVIYTYLEELKRLFQFRIDYLNQAKTELEIKYNSINDKYNLGIVNNNITTNNSIISNKDRTEINNKIKDVIKNDNKNKFINGSQIELTKISKDLDLVNQELIEINKLLFSFIDEHDDYSFNKILELFRKISSSINKNKPKFKRLQKRSKISYRKNREGHIIRSYSSSALQTTESNFNQLDDLNLIHDTLIKKEIDLYPINSDFYIDLKRILSESFRFDKNIQLKIEYYLHNRGKEILKEKLDVAKDINYDKIGFNIKKMLIDSVPDLVDLINNYRNNLSGINSFSKKSRLKYLNEQQLICSKLSNDYFISLAFGRLLRIISNNGLENHNTIYSYVAEDIGLDMVNTYLYLCTNIDKDIDIEDNNFNFSESYSLTKTKLFSEDYFHDFDNDQLYFYLGSEIIDMLINLGFIEIDTIQTSQILKKSVLKCKGELSKLLGKNQSFVNIGKKIPMVVKPKSYTMSSLGGYLLNDILYIEPLIIKNPELKNQSVILEDNSIYDMVNNISSVGYKINKKVFNFIVNYGIRLNLVINPNKIHDLCFKKEKLTLLDKKEILGFNSKKDLEMNIMLLAELFLNVKEFFIPVRIDIRGRLYCVSDYFHYQSIDLAKSLLLFSKGEKLWLNQDDKAINYLKIYGANCFGLSKKSNLERIEWVNQNHENILNFRNFKLIENAKSKLLFLAFCFEYELFEEAKKNNMAYYITYLPLQFDSTCNGFQHIALLTNDLKLAKELNLLESSDAEKPKDFYSHIAEKLKETLHNLVKYRKEKQAIQIDNDINDSNEKGDRELYSLEKLCDLTITRELVKPSIMVEPYNASIFSQAAYTEEGLIRKTRNKVIYTKDIKNMKKRSELEAKQIFEISFVENYFVDKVKCDSQFTENDLIVFNKYLKKLIYSEFDKLKEFKDYLINIAKLCNKLNMGIPWVLPTGLKISQEYMNTTPIRLKPFSHRKNTFVLVERTGTINKNKQIRALMPNLIHSLDASSLALLVKYFRDLKNKDKQIFNFYSIHDCFASTANNVSTLLEFTLVVYKLLYFDDKYLINFHKGIIDQIKLKFGNESFDESANMINVKLSWENGVEEVIRLPMPNNVSLMNGSLPCIDFKKVKYHYN